MSVSDMPFLSNYLAMQLLTKDKITKYEHKWLIDGLIEWLIDWLVHNRFSVVLQLYHGDEHK
jgi:hypothetical protein